MKTNNKYILALLSIVLTFSACKENIPDFFDEDYNGAYFNYENSGDFKYELNFSNHIYGRPDAVAVPVKVKLLGYLSNDKRSVAIKTKAVEDYEMPEITIPEVFFSDKEYEKEIEVMVKRPEKEGEEYAICLYLDGSGDLGGGIKGKDEFIIYVTEKYEKPELWEGYFIETYILGEYKPEKHIYLADLTQDDDFLRKLYSEITADRKIIDEKAALGLNSAVFNAMFAEAEPVALSFPIITEKTYNPSYEEPYFWNKYSRHECNFTIDRFLEIHAGAMGLNTTNIEALYAENKASMENLKKKFHIEDVYEILENYNSYAAEGVPVSEYKERSWMEMTLSFINDYKNVVKPYWWEDPDNLGTKEVIEHYFGEYNQDKYGYMLQWIKLQFKSEFVPAMIFPFIRNIDTNSYSWDLEAGGEEFMQECYRIIKAKYDKSPTNIRNKFSLPELDI